MARMFARLHATQRKFVRPASTEIDQPAGAPPGKHGSIRPQREQVRDAFVPSRLGIARILPAGLPPSAWGAGLPGGDRASPWAGA